MTKRKVRETTLTTIITITKHEDNARKRSVLGRTLEP
jgi:hypothetical protein